MDGGVTHVWHAVVRVFVNIKGSAISVRNVKEVVSAHIKEFGHSAKIAEADPFANTTVFALCVECGGGSICEHKRIRGKCNLCRVGCWVKRWSSRTTVLIS